ncbi:MAG TPA: ATP-binding protein [Solirubrobacterales bacterium]|nr:ATP-binding protein [Solirubrobacterales bacterium]
MPSKTRPLLDRLKAWLGGSTAGVQPAGGDDRRAGSAAPPLPASAAGGRWDEILRVQELTLSLLSSKVTPDELFRHVVDGAADSLSADEASLMLVEGEELRVASSTRTPAGEAEAWQQRSRLGEGVAGWVAQTGSPVLLSEGDDLSRFPNLVPKGGRIQSAVSVPLEVGGRVVGVLNANRLASGARFTSSDLAVLRLFASTAALAIDQASLLQRAQARTRAVEALLAVVDAFVTGAEPAKALRAVMPRLATAFRPTQALAFLAAGGDKTALTAVAGWDTGPLDHGALDGTTLALADDLGRLVERGQPAWVSGIPLSGGPPWLRQGAVPWLMLPIGAGEASPRCLLALSWDDPAFELPPEELRVLEGLAGQIGVALAREDRAAVVGALQDQVSQARTHLVEVERLATIGQSMAGLVHDINAPLTALMTLAQMIQSDPGSDRTSRERSGQIIQAAQRAQRLVRELLTMAKPRPPTFEPVDLNALVKQTMDLERPQCSVAAIKLIGDFEADLPRVTADPHRLGQVLMNLLGNARQAMEASEKGRTLTVRTRRHGEMVEIHVIDDGPGIPDELKGKIFDWFFTTKPPGEGTGLGLAVSREILQAHGGNLRLDDTPGGGATFILDLPQERPGS